MFRSNEPIQQKEFIKTYVRIKPILNDNQNKAFYCPDHHTIVARSGAKFTYNHVFDQKNPTERVYQVVARPIIDQSLKGFNGCILAYGQTSSGKTHTMKGTQNEPGIVTLALVDIFLMIKEADLAAKIEISYLEIYNEKVYDLLSDKDSNEVLVQSSQNTLSLTNLKHQLVMNFDDAIKLFDKGEERRKFSSNNINLNSSRSHTIFRIAIYAVLNDFTEMKTQIDLVDLAGSQSLDKTKNEKIAKTEGQNINKSLLALSRIITILSQKKNDLQISFRDSKLTRILQKSLCQNAKSSIICMINPNEQNFQESINTLKFGLNAHKIKIQARQNLNKTQESKNMSRWGNFSNDQRKELEQAREKIKNDQSFINDLQDKLNELHLMNQRWQTKFILIQQKNKQIEDEMKDLKANHKYERDELIRLKNNLESQVDAQEQQIKKLEETLETNRRHMRAIQKSEQNAVKALADSQKICSQLQKSLQDLNNQIQEETEKIEKIKSHKKEPLIKSKKRPNDPYDYKPPKQYPKRQIDNDSLKDMIRCRHQILDLNFKIRKYTQINCEIAEENQDLRHRVHELQNKKSQEISSKINPQILENQEIRRLKKSVKFHQTLTKLAEKRLQQCREMLKQSTQKNLIKLREYQEWYHWKYDSNIFQDMSIQTNITGENFEIMLPEPRLNDYDRQNENEYSRRTQKMEIQQPPVYNPFMNALPKQSPLKSETLDVKNHHFQNRSSQRTRKIDNPESDVRPSPNNFIVSRDNQRGIYSNGYAFTFDNSNSFSNNNQNNPYNTRNINSPQSIFGPLREYTRNQGSPSKNQNNLSGIFKINFEGQEKQERKEEQKEIDI